MKVEYYTKNKKVYHYYPSQAESEELDELRRKQRYARQKAEKEEAEQYRLDHSKGYCKCCFMLKPLTGICPNCN